MKFNELRDMVVGIWLADGSHDSHDFLTSDPDSSFKDFLRDWSRGLRKTERVQFIECEGGEGEGEHAESVIKVDGVFYKITYSYYSYDGYQWDYAEVDVVSPVERMVTFYEQI